MFRWKPKSLEDIIELMQRTAETWLREWPDAGELSDDKILELMDGHAILDDPPKDYTRRDLAMWCRGYLHASHIRVWNCANTLEEIMKQTKLLTKILAAQKKSEKKRAHY